MVIIFHISISLFNFTFELSTEFKWGITARHRTNMPYIESFSRTFDQNGDTLSYLIGIVSRGRTSPHHGHGRLHDCCPGLAPWLLSRDHLDINLSSCLHHTAVFMLGYRSHIILTWG